MAKPKKLRTLLTYKIRFRLPGYLDSKTIKVKEPSHMYNFRAMIKAALLATLSKAGVKMKPFMVRMDPMKPSEGHIISLHQSKKGKNIPKRVLGGFKIREIYI